MRQWIGSALVQVMACRMFCDERRAPPICILTTTDNILKKCTFCTTSYGTNYGSRIMIIWKDHFGNNTFKFLQNTNFEIRCILCSATLFCTMDLLPDTENWGLRMHRECREPFICHQLQNKPLISDPGMHHGTCVTDVPWCMSGSLTHGGGENVPGIPGACTTHNFPYLLRGPRVIYVQYNQFHIEYDDYVNYISVFLLLMYKQMP